MPPQTTAPAGYQPQSSDTSVEADWILFENLRQMPVADRHKRFRTFNCTWRNRLWWLCREEQNPIETYLQQLQAKPTSFKRGMYRKALLSAVNLPNFGGDLL